MLFRFRYEERGGHTHVRLFAGRSEAALGKCGDLVFRNEEFAVLKESIEIAEEFVNPLGLCVIEFKPEGET